MAIEDLMTGGTVLPITRWGTPVMHEETKPVTSFDDELHQLWTLARSRPGGPPLIARYLQAA